MAPRPDAHTMHPEIQVITMPTVDMIPNIVFEEPADTAAQQVSNIQEDFMTIFGYRLSGSFLRD